jgi:uncharacterized membrane protein
MAATRAGKVLATFMAGLLVLLPLTITLALLAWLASVLNGLIGPGTLVGRGFSALGYTVVENDRIAYLVGTLLLVAAIYVLGLAVERGLRGPLKRYGLDLFHRVPLLGRLYGFAEKLVGLIDRRHAEEMEHMGAVWCFFGKAAVLALAPGRDPVTIEGQPYVGVLIPTAPVPIGGALLYLPADWVKPANIGIDRLTAVYVSMGLTPPTPA